MPTFLVAILLVIAFVAGSAMALRPSPRQRQLARLRERAVALRLRVQWQPGGQEVDYLLPWAAAEAGRARALRFDVERSVAGGWQGVSGDENASAEVASALARLPSSVTRVRTLAEGVAARWGESGTVSEVDDIAHALRDVAASLLHGS